VHENRCQYIYTLKDILK